MYCDFSERNGEGPPKNTWTDDSSWFVVTARMLGAGRRAPPSWVPTLIRILGPATTTTTTTSIIIVVVVIIRFILIISVGVVIDIMI